MKLTKFRVTNFRSVNDSGWIDVDDVTALIGVNESGKSNLLLALWKLKPANEGDIQPTSDYPKAQFGDIRPEPEKFAFISAEFDTGQSAKWLAQKAGITSEEAAKVIVTRYFNGEHTVDFPCYRRKTTIGRAALVGLLQDYANQIDSGKELKKEAGLRDSLHKSLYRIIEDLPPNEEIEAKQLRSIKDAVLELVPGDPAKLSAIVPLVRQLVDDLNKHIGQITAMPPGRREEVVFSVVKNIPAFVYYTHYGNLDSEIYLPHVVVNLQRDDLGTKELAKARTLRVLFSFVGLEAQEILDLGNEPSRNLTGEQAAEIGEKKKERSILLTSASAKLTEKFRDWWRQGDYRFRFEADGNHFRIWVSDDRRPTDVELENRSSGLQWFLSFYVVFLVESEEDYNEAVLLLDEPGMSLHPHAQQDLSAFFDNLAKTNQILYTSHSPFLIDADRLERARKVYVANDGSTKATADLRRNEGRDEQAGAAYAVHSALNLSVGESILVGCRPVLVEGVSDQHYLTAIKSLLIAAGKIKPSRELVFPPSGGAKNVRTVASILAGRDGSPPTVLLDSDRHGRDTKKVLTSNNGLYAEHSNYVLPVGDFVDAVRENAEVEDLFPHKFLAEELDRMVREPAVPLEDKLEPGIPFVSQVELWAESQSAALPKHWKVELARRVKERMLRRGMQEFDDEVSERWTKLFNAFES